MSALLRVSCSRAHWQTGIELAWCSIKSSQRGFDLQRHAKSRIEDCGVLFRCVKVWPYITPEPASLDRLWCMAFAWPKVSRLESQDTLLIEEARRTSIGGKLVVGLKYRFRMTHFSCFNIIS